MAYENMLRDSVADTTTSTGTGDIILSETPPIGCRTFGTAYGSGEDSPCIVTIRDDATGDFETCLAVYNHTTKTITRGDIFSSSLGVSRVNFVAGTKRIYVSVPSAIFNAPRWRELNLTTYITIRETLQTDIVDNPLPITDTSKPASPQVTGTVFSGDIIAQENIEGYGAIFAVSFNNAGGSGTTTYRYQFTLNGIDIGSEAQTNLSANQSGGIALRYAGDIVAGDVFGCKIWRTTGTGNGGIYWTHYAAFPRKVILTAGQVLMKMEYAVPFKINAEILGYSINFSQKISRSDWSSSTFSLATNIFAYLNPSHTLFIDGNATETHNGSFAATKSSITLNNFPAVLSFLTMNDLAP